MKLTFQWCLGMLLLAFLAGACGCATTGDSENRAERPWNAPMNWEYGLPPSMMEGR